jgi:hypothetical protein
MATANNTPHTIMVAVFQDDVLHEGQICTFSCRRCCCQLLLLLPPLLIMLKQTPWDKMPSLDTRSRAQI